MSAVPPLPNNVPNNIPNYLVWSILNTIGAFIVCCIACLSFPAIITGIVAIVFSAQVNSKLNQGDVTGAQRASQNAKTWNWVTTGITVLALVGAVIYFLTVGLDGYVEFMDEFRRQMEQQQH
jgi:hypothetical protein